MLTKDIIDENANEQIIVKDILKKKILSKIKNKSSIKPEMILATPQVSHKRKVIIHKQSETKKRRVSIQQDEEKITDSSEVFADYENKTICGILFRTVLFEIYQNFSSCFTSLQYNKCRLKNIKNNDKCGDILISHLYSFVHGEYCMQKRENRETSTAPKLDVLNTKNIKRVHFKRYDFSTILTPNEGIEDSQEDIIFMINLLSEINYEFTIIRKFICDNKDSKFIELINNFTDILYKISESDKYSIDTVNSAKYYRDLFIQLLNIDKPRPLSQNFGNYLSSIIRYYMRKEFNAYDRSVYYYYYY